MIADAKQVAPDRPFFMYYCPGANHAPHQPPKEWADKYKGTFDMGYEKIREQILANQKKMGIVPGNTELSPINPLAGLTSVDGKQQSPFDLVRPWDSLSEDEKAIMVRMAEVYAGLCSYTDHEIGRLIDYLERIGELDNTLIVWISDNGASGEGGPDGSINENFFFNGVLPEMKDNLAMLDKLGSPETYNHYSTGWAMAFNTPCKMFKRHTWEGGVADPMIVHWPKGIKAKGETARPVHALLRHRADGLRVPGHRPARGRQGLHPMGSGRHQLQVHLRRRERRDAEAQPVLRHARHPRDLARRLEGRGPARRRTVGLEPLRRGQVGAVPRAGGPLRMPRPGRRAPRAAQRADRALVPPGRAILRPAARGPHRDRGARPPHGRR